MNRSLTRLGIFSIGAIALLASGCTTVLMETGEKSLEDRSTENQVTDTKMAKNFLSDLSGKDKGLLLDVNVDVWEQRVLLTGTLDDPNVRDEVVQMAKADARHKALYDEIQIVHSGRKGTSS